MSVLDKSPRHQEVQPIPCGILAGFIHYFVLSSLAWMGVEGLNTYLVIVRVFNSYIPNFMTYAALVAWGKYTLDLFSLHLNAEYGCLFYYRSKLYTNILKQYE